MSRAGHDDQFILDAIRRDRPLRFMTGVMMIVAAALAISVPLNGHLPAWAPLARIALSAGALVMAWVVFALALRAPERDPAIRLLRDEPQRIVWAHVLINRVNRVHTGTTLVLYTDTKRCHRVALPCSDEGAQRGMDLVAAVAPNATLGFSSDYRRQYRRDPASMRTA